MSSDVAYPLLVQKQINPSVPSCSEEKSLNQTRYTKKGSLSRIRSIDVEGRIPGMVGIDLHRLDGIGTEIGSEASEPRGCMHPLNAGRKRDRAAAVRPFLASQPPPLPVGHRKPSRRRCLPGSIRGGWRRRPPRGRRRGPDRRPCPPAALCLVDFRPAPTRLPQSAHRPRT